MWCRWLRASSASPLEDPGSLTRTGGLTFGGGPGNNYTTHGIAPLGPFRQKPGAVHDHGLGWFATKHAVGRLDSGAQPTAERQLGFPGGTSSRRSTCRRGAICG